ncbi:hypothetical protein [Inquilinus sp. CAU 1745]|uniref:hypothetical protein n=1 Tax=Inquilinus sp. CAU 1745 TaxID=3140369 RepID=UPI00325B0154
MTPIAERLARAKGYPYEAPEGSYLFADGETRPFRPDTLAGRTPVIAYGSNRSPLQLARKYAGWPAGTEIPVTVARLGGMDVVHSCHFTAYGSLPAMVVPARGVTVTVAIVWLDGRQLERMHETEGGENYHYGSFEATELELDCPLPPALYGYHGRRGAFAPDGPPLALAAIPATGRTGPAATQEQALARARDLLAPGADLDLFILEIIDDPALRAERTEALAAFSSRQYAP